ncbi:MAG TPA: hypothetical protein VMY78_12815 [Solirubrobacteraceae bacterium]|nr:hypothetical protein [Solirubrobacteraceae bacterium]
MTEPLHVYRRRRAVAVGVVVAVAILVVALAARGGGDGEPAAGEAQPAAAVRPPPAELPRGGRRLFPDQRVVAFYGAPQSERLGTLGIGTPDEASKRLRRVARGYAKKTRPVLPAFELIATIAAEHPGDDGMHRIHQPDEVIARYLAAARRAKALLLLDIQPGRGDFLSEAQRLERWLREPDVGLALDPEWHVGLAEIPGQTIGSVTADDVNEVASYVAGIVQRGDLPEKLFVVHQFTSDMIAGKERVQRPPGLAMTMNVDGFGDRPNKISKYDQFTSEAARFNDGFKLFYEEDTNLMEPGDVLALGPPPDLVVYE